MSYFNNLNSCYLIAEIGVNHNGNIEMAFKMIDEAKGIGLDAVKFQTFSADALVSKDSPKVEYQQSTTSPGGTQYYSSFETDLIKLQDKYGLNYQLHNYFPPPPNHFVLNLASINKDIYNNSIKFAKKAISLSKRFIISSALLIRSPLSGWQSIYSSSTPRVNRLS